jgi:hypothetical protein
MRVDRLFVLVVVLVTLGARPSFGQSTYVSVALVGDVLLNTHVETSLGTGAPSGGEAIGFALRVGTPLGSRWGVELEFTRAGEIESEFDGVIPLGSRASSAISWASLPTGSVPPEIDALFPILQRPTSYSLQTTQRHSTLSTIVWMNQELSPRVSLVYLAGMGFSRTTFENESRFEILPLPPGISIPNIFPAITKTVTYGVRPLAGIEGRIGLTEHVDLVPGIRLHGLDNGWLLRPAVGLAWNF